MSVQPTDPVTTALDLYSEPPLVSALVTEPKKSFFSKWFKPKSKTVTFALSTPSKYTGGQIAIMVIFVIIVVGIIAAIISGIATNDFSGEPAAPPPPVARSVTGTTTRRPVAKNAEVITQTISLPSDKPLSYYKPFARRAAFILYGLPESIVAVDTLSVDFLQDMPITSPVHLMLAFDNNEREARGRDASLRTTTTYRGVPVPNSVIHVHIEDNNITAFVTNNVGSVQAVNTVELPINTECAGMQIVLNIANGMITLGASFLGTVADRLTDASYIDSLNNDLEANVTDYQEQSTELTAWKPGFFYAVINSVYFSDTNKSYRDMTKFNFNLVSSYQTSVDKSIIVNYGAVEKYTKGVEAQAMYKGALVESNMYQTLPLTASGLTMTNNDALILQLSDPWVPNIDKDVLTLMLQGSMITGPFDLTAFNMTGSDPNPVDDLAVATWAFKAQGKVYAANPALYQDIMEDEIDLAPIMSYTLANTYKYEMSLASQTVTFHKGTDTVLKATGTLSTGVLSPIHYFILRGGYSQTSTLTGYIRQLTIEKTIQ